MGLIRQCRLSVVDPWVAVIMLGAVTLEMLVSARYGYHRDELYFLVAGQHPALGYVDQPPLAPLVARWEADLFANSLVGLRVIPALLLAWLVWASSSISRIYGGGRAAQRIAALATALCGEYVATAHLLTTTVFDFAAWAGVLWSCAHYFVDERFRWVVVAATFAGVGLDAKWNIVFLIFALACGVGATAPARRLTSWRTTTVAALIIVALGWPDVLWQATHGWPNESVFRALQGAATHNRLVYWPAQILYTGIVATPLWWAGVRDLLSRTSPDRRWRAIGVACVVALVTQFVLGGKPYYAGGVFVMLFGVGAVAAERRWTRQRFEHGHSAGPRWLTTALIVSGAATLPLAIPITSARSLHSVPLQKINYDLAETIAWPREVAQVAAVYRGLAPAVRSAAVVVAGNYGEAGALERYGAQFGLAHTRVFSGANSFWLWGPPPRWATTIVAVNLEPALLHRLFTQVRLALVYRNGLGVSNDEQGIEVMVATGLRTPWSRSWRDFRDYS